MTVQPPEILAPAVTVYGTPACVQCKSVVRTITDRGYTPTYVDLTTDPDAEAYVRTESADDLRLPFVVVALPNGEHRTFNGNRRDIIDELFPRAAA